MVDLSSIFTSKLVGSVFTAASDDFHELCKVDEVLQYPPMIASFDCNAAAKWSHAAVAMAKSIMKGYLCVGRGLLIK